MNAQNSLKRLYGIICLLLSINLCAQEVCDNGIDDDGDGLIDCYDPDCSGSSLCDDSFFGQNASCQFAPNSDNFDMSQEWLTDDNLYDIFSTLTPISGDWDNDGVVEVFAFSHNDLQGESAGLGNKVYVINGNNGIVEDSIILPVLPPNFQTSGIALGDLNNNGFGELVVFGNDFKLRCYDHNNTLLWTTPPIGVTYYPTVNIADFNEDGNPEVFCSSFIFNGQSGALIGSAGSPFNGYGSITSYTWYPYPSSTAMDLLPTGFCADCGGVELLAGNVVYSVNIATGTLTPLVNSVLAGSDGLTTIADYDLDGDLDAIISSTPLPFGNFTSFVYVWDIQTSSTLAISNTFSSTDFDSSIGQCTVGDFDNDGLPEIAVVSENKLHVLDDYLNNLESIWTKEVNDLSGVSGTSIFDFQGDGELEIIYQDSDSLYVIEGSSGDVLSASSCNSATYFNNPVVLDVDNDNQAEIICACSNTSSIDGQLKGYVRAFGAANEPWADARSVWNQSSYNVTNINDDLSIPIYQQDPSIVGDSIVLNAFKLQSTILMPDGNPTFAAADAAPIITNVYTDSCGTESNTIELKITVENLSPDLILPAGNPVSIYNGNPLEEGATLIETVILFNEIDILDNDTFSIIIPDQGGNFELFVVTSDTGHVETPISFPNIGLGECDFNNNIVSQTISCGEPCTFNTWEGNIDNNWFEPSNWSCMIVPDSTMDVSIPMGTIPCLINTGMNATVKNIEIDPSAVLTINGALEIIYIE